LYLTTQIINLGEISVFLSFCIALLHALRGLPHLPLGQLGGAFYLFLLQIFALRFWI
jgi:hypothetical protein